MDKKFWATTFTLTGTIIGAGILGLPYVFSKSGFISGVFWIIALGIMMIYVNLCLAEVTLRTKGKHQLTGYAEKYLGKKAEALMFFAMIFGIYSALLAYLVGEGDSLSQILPGNINPIFLGIGFWLLMTFLLKGGLEGLKKIETYGVMAIILIIIGAFIYYFPQIKVDNIMTLDKSNFFFPFGVVLFSILGFTSIPELRQEIKGSESKFRKAIILGVVIPIILYLMFSAIFVGILGGSVTEVATLSFGPFMILLGIFTMMTSFFVMSFALSDMFKYDLKFSKTKTFALASFAPLVLYILIEKLNLLGFSSILGIGGVISGGVTGILILLMSMKAKKKSARKPEFTMPLNWTTIIILSLIFIAGIIIEFMH